MDDSRIMEAAEQRAREFLDGGQIESYKVELMAEDILNLVDELRVHRSEQQRVQGLILDYFAREDGRRDRGEYRDATAADAAPPQVAGAAGVARLADAGPTHRPVGAAT
jgi:hypothetical protein